MGRRSTFERLPQEIVDAVNRRIRAGDTAAEICTLLDEAGHPTAERTVQRYVGNTREQLAKARAARDVAGQWVQELGENPTGDVGVLLAEMLKTVAYSHLDQMLAPAEGEAPKKPHKAMDLMLLAKMIRDLEATAKASMDRKAAIEKAVLERQTKAAEKVAKQRGLSREQWAAIRAEFLGIPDKTKDDGEAAPA